MIKKVVIGLLSSAAIIIIVISTYLYVTPSVCSVDEKYAYNKVIKHLGKENLPIKYLPKSGKSAGNCRYSYMYEGGGNKIEFVVIDDFVRGAKLTYWDYNEREQ